MMISFEKIENTRRSITRVTQDFLRRYPPARQLGAFAFIALGTLALIEALTVESIERHQEMATRAKLQEVLGGIPYDQDLLEHPILIEDQRLGTPTVTAFFLARHQGIVAATAFRILAPGGYNGPIELMMAVDQHENLAGVRVLRHQETPGLGDLIEARKSAWILSFNGKSLSNPSSRDWRIRRDGGSFDQFTGATITPRAVLEAVRNGLLVVHDHRARLFGAASETQVPAAMTP